METAAPDLTGTALDESLVLGRPRFGQAPSVASDRSAIAAWRQLLAQQGAAKAACGVKGDFAIGLRDPSGRAFMAIDRFGIQTLCYRVVGNELRFARRADELAGPGARIDPQAIYDYLYFHVIPSPRTIYQDVFRLPPGHYALFENGKLTVAPYWEPQFVEPRDASFTALKEEFRSMLLSSVERQLGHGMPACFLSGGTDSSTIAGLIGRIAGRPASTYSIGFEADGYDEMQYARLAARHFGTDHHEYYLTPSDLVESIAQVAKHCDQPFGNSSILPAYYCELTAKGDGVARLLAGDGGDELFGGNSRYATQRVFDWYHAVPPILRSAIVEPVFGAPLIARMPVLRKGASYIRQASLPLPDRLQTYNLLQRLGAAEALTPAFLSLVDQQGPISQQRAIWAQAKTESMLNRMLAFDWRYTLAESDLPKVRGSAECAGIEVGFPFLDDDLLDFSSRLPEAYKLKGLSLRWFFKEALRDFLPAEIIAKKKHGFGLPFGVWVTRDAALLRLATESVHCLASRGLVRREFADSLLEARLQKHPGYYGEFVWVFVMLEHWLRGHAPGYALGG